MKKKNKKNNAVSNLARISELYGDRSRDITKEKIGSTSIFFTGTPPPKTKQDKEDRIEDEVGATVRYLNMRKGR